MLLTPGRSIALDSRIFPKGALGFIVCQKPSINDDGEIVGWTKFSRFVVNQDTGGAIKGAGRADIFWGSGPYAELTAGHLRQEGDLYLLIKKPWVRVPPVSPRPALFPAFAEAAARGTRLWQAGLRAGRPGGERKGRRTVTRSR